MSAQTQRLRHAVQQYRIDDEDGIALWELRAFAQECGHKLEPIFPIFAVTIDGKLGAFYYATPQVVIRPTIHPNLLTAREFYDAATMVVWATKRAFLNPIWIVDEKSPLATPELLTKIGLHPTSQAVLEVE